MSSLHKKGKETRIYVSLRYIEKLQELLVENPIRLHL